MHYRQVHINQKRGSQKTLIKENIGWHFFHAKFELIIKLIHSPCVLYRHISITWDNMYICMHLLTFIFLSCCLVVLWLLSKLSCFTFKLIIFLSTSMRLSSTSPNSEFPEVSSAPPPCPSRLFNNSSWEASSAPWSLLAYIQDINTNIWWVHAVLTNIVATSLITPKLVLLFRASIYIRISMITGTYKLG